MVNIDKYIIGLHWEQNSTVALMLNGKILESTSEERFSKIKNDERYPLNSLNYLIKKYKLTSENIYAVCVISKCFSPVYSLVRHYTNFSMDDYFKEQNEVWYKKFYENKNVHFLKVFKNKLNINQYPGQTYWKKVIKQINKYPSYLEKKKIFKFGQKIRSKIISKHLDISHDKINFIDHSFGHAAYAYCSGDKNGKISSVFTIDAFGDFKNYSCYKFFKEKGLIKYKKIVSGDSSVIARLYRYTTLLLGFKPNEHEYKLMGMAPYAKEKYYEDIFLEFKKIQIIKKNSFKFVNKPKDLFFSIKKILSSKRFDNICGALQKYTEYLLINWVKNCIKTSKAKDICLAGGVAMNVKANLELSKLKEVNSIFVPPSPDDGSQAMGACFAFSLQKKDLNKNLKKLDNAYLGYEINAKICNSFILKKKISKTKYVIIKKNINLVAARLLKNNLILCRATGRAEFGARSLGNRSILANPKMNHLKKKINEKVKGRDFWMPFAASIIDRHSKKYFYLNSKIEDYQFMTNCVETTKKGKKDLIAAIHPYDETCRPHILLKKNNPEYYDLINKFGKLTGIYGLLNTSFNIHGKPIVNDVKDAFEVFKKTDLDGIIFTNCLVLKKENSKYL